MSEIAIKNLKDAFFAEDDTKMVDLTQKALDTGVSAFELLDKYIIPWTKQLTASDMLQLKVQTVARRRAQRVSNRWT